MKTEVEINMTQRDYLMKVNFWMLLLCLAHIPVIAGIAYYFDSGVMSALIIGGIIGAGPLTTYMIKRESQLTSIVLGVAFMGFSALLIHHARGMIEMHFHIFAFIAMLIVFANPWVVAAAAGTIAVHHVSFYFLLPKSVFNYQASFGIVVVHAVFVIVETIPAVLISNIFSKYIIAQGSIIKKLEALSDKILNSAQAAAVSGSNLSQNAKEQSQALQSTVNAMEEVSTMIHETAENATKSQDVSRSSKKSADQGQSSITKMISSIEEIGKYNSQMISRFDHLNTELTEIVKIINEIGSKTKVIDEIVFQTKLLSFNASVEAARAGEHGKGFAVVAEEIGSLATMSGKSSQEINELLQGSISTVEKIVSESRTQITQITEVTQDKIKQGSFTAGECQEALGLIVSNIDEAIKFMNYVNTSSIEQSRNVQDITKAMKKINDLTQENTKAADYSEDKTHEIKEQALGIKEVVESLIKAVS